MAYNLIKKKNIIHFYYNWIIFKKTYPFNQIAIRLYPRFMICPYNWNPLSMAFTYQQAVTARILVVRYVKGNDLSFKEA